MDFAFNEMQEMLQKSARDFLSREYPDKLLREMVKGEKGFTHGLWRKMAEMNWMGLSIPEEYEGVGGFLDMAVVLEEMGRVCFISPFFSTLVLGASSIIEAGNDSQKQRFLPYIARGKLIITMALTEPSVRYMSDEIKVKAIHENDNYVINGTKLFVPDAHVSDYLVCVARTDESGSPEDGITLFLVDINMPGLTHKLLETIAGDKQCEVTFDNVLVSSESVLGEVGKGWQHVEKVMEMATVASCAEIIGAVHKVLEMTLDYAKERIAFGHPIGAFQSIQHRCADMLIDVEGARAITYKAACRINQNLPAEKEVAIAKAWVNQASRRVVNSAHQVHGAIGFTEDHILHFYTKRVRAHEFIFGDVDYHLNRLASLSL